MGPSAGMKNPKSSILNDEESNSLSSSSVHVQSPIQLYENPGILIFFWVLFAVNNCCLHTFFF